MNMDMASPKWLVLGLGNEILGDDAIGIVVAKRIFDALSHARRGIEVHFASAELGGWRLVDLLPGYDRILIIDSVQTSGGEVGRCYRISLDGCDTAHLTSAHGVNLAEAIAMAYPNPAEAAQISVYGVEAARVWDFGVGLSADLARLVPAIVDEILADLVQPVAL